MERYSSRCSQFSGPGDCCPNWRATVIFFGEQCSKPRFVDEYSMFFTIHLLANARSIQNLWTRYWMVRDGWRGFPCSSPSCWCPKVMSSVYLHELFRYIMKPTVKLELCHTFVTNLALLQLYWPGACSLWISIPFNRWDEDPGLDATGHLRWKELLLGGTLWKKPGAIRPLCKYVFFGDCYYTSVLLYMLLCFVIGIIVMINVVLIDVMFHVYHDRCSDYD